jgi:hypothetical protein
VPLYCGVTKELGCHERRVCRKEEKLKKQPDKTQVKPLEIEAAKLKTSINHFQLKLQD